MIGLVSTIVACVGISSEDGAERNARVSGYGIALFVHLLSLLMTVAASSLATFAAWRIRGGQRVDEVLQWEALMAKAERVHPVATVGLVASGAYMTYRSWTWGTPWILGGIVGLLLIILLGAVIGGNRARALVRSLEQTGLGVQSRQLLRDPAAWTARTTTWALVVAVVFLMTVKPGAAGSMAALVVALIVGALGALPLWRGAETATLTTLNENLASPR